MSNIVDWASQGADAFKAFCITSGYREQINEGLWDWLDANGYTQNSLNDKINAALVDGFDFSSWGIAIAPSSSLLLEDGTYLLIEDGSYLLLE